MSGRAAATVYVVLDDRGEVVRETKTPPVGERFNVASSQDQAPSGGHFDGAAGISVTVEDEFASDGTG